MTESIYESAGGMPALIRLAQAWHSRCLADEVMSHPFRHGVHPHHTERLAAYWAESLGGPPAFSEAMGNESSVLRVHAGNGEHQDMDERGIACFDLALDDARLPADPRLRATLKEYFRWATHRMAAYPSSPNDVPRGLAIARWTWEGPA